MDAADKFILSLLGLLLVWMSVTTAYQVGLEHGVSFTSVLPGWLVVFLP